MADIIPINKIIFELVSEQDGIVPAPIESYSYSHPIYTYKIGETIKYTRSLLDEEDQIVIYNVVDVKHEVHETYGICEQHVIVYLEIQS